MNNRMYYRNKDSVFYIAGNKLFILDEQHDEVIIINETGLWLWEKLKNKYTLEELTSALISDYNISIQEAKNQIKSFLNSLKKRELIKTILSR